MIVYSDAVCVCVLFLRVTTEVSKKKIPSSEEEEEDAPPSAQEFAAQCMTFTWKKKPPVLIFLAYHRCPCLAHDLFFFLVQKRQQISFYRNV